MSTVDKDLADLRREYITTSLRRADLAPGALQQFDCWFEEALNAKVMDPNAMSVATVSAGGQPSLRTVLLKSFDTSGFVFYTNLNSHKAKEIAGTPRVALLFYWHELNRQVKVIGTAQRTTVEENLQYFSRRPKDSQLAAWASTQSKVISARSILENKFTKLKKQYANDAVPLPPFWGGYRVVPSSVEFWQGRANRLHDRFCYTLSAADTWSIERLAP